MSFNSRVTAAILSADSGITAVGFGKVLYASRTASFGTDHEIRSYNNINEVNADTDLSTTDLAKAAAFFGQDKHPRPLLIAQCPAAASQDIKFAITGTIVSGDDFSITIDGIVSSFTATTTVAADVAAGLKAAMDIALGALDVSPGVSGDDVTCSADVAGEGFTYSSTTDSTAGDITESVTQANVSFGTSLAALRLANDEFFGVLVEASDDIELTNVAVWAAADGFALPSLHSNSAAAKSGATTGNIAKDLKDGGYDVILTVDANLTDYVDVCALAYGLAPGPDVSSSSWNGLQLTGPTPDSLTLTEKNNVTAQDANVYTTFYSTNAWGEGKLSSGTKIANFITEIWYREGVKTEAASILAAAVAAGKKIPYTDKGIAQLVTAIRIVQERGAATDSPHFARKDNGAVDGTIDVPLASEQSTAAKTAGTITIPSTVTLAGQVDSVYFPLTVTLG